MINGIDSFQKSRDENKSVNARQWKITYAEWNTKWMSQLHGEVAQFDIGRGKRTEERTKRMKDHGTERMQRWSDSARERIHFIKTSCLLISYACKCTTALVPATDPDPGKQGIEMLDYTKSISLRLRFSNILWNQNGNEMEERRPRMHDARSARDGGSNVHARKPISRLYAHVGWMQRQFSSNSSWFIVYLWLKIN